jgi:hypothetical protein
MSGSELSDLEALLVRVLPDPAGFGRRVMEQVMDRLATDRPNGAPVTVAMGPDPHLHETLLDHNVLLAAALGACDCWGNDPGCRSCSGEGVPGWRLPDAQLYDEFVAPAVARMAGTVRPAHLPAEPTEGNRSEYHVAGQQ